MTSPLVKKAILFATKAHRNQLRKYTGEPYIVHPLAVMEIVATVDHTDEMLAAAVLHDVVEDCDVTIQDVCDEFGTVVGMYVEYLTDVSKPEHGNRATRKEMDAWHYSRGPAESQTIKVADLIHNTADIHKHDPRFWEVYKHEKWLVLNRLTKADPILWERARVQIKELW
jgi:(p)ppGpp synthase/HD superfamily hydrolase